MAKDVNARRLDTAAFAHAGARLSGDSPLASWPRLLDETEGRGPDRIVRWQARGEQRRANTLQAQDWLHLQATALLPLTCQRCLQAVDTPLEVDRWFRFAADEASAQAQDESSEEDVLATSAEFDLLSLVEDELLLAMPLVPRHDVCPTDVRLAARDDGFKDKQNPFETLRELKQDGKL